MVPWDGERGEGPPEGLGEGVVPEGTGGAGLPGGSGVCTVRDGGGDAVVAVSGGSADIPWAVRAGEDTVSEHLNGGLVTLGVFPVSFTGAQSTQSPMRLTKCSEQTGLPHFTQRWGALSTLQMEQNPSFHTPPSAGLLIMVRALS